ncbi:MAG: hypothetical protein ACRD3Y_02295 [Bryobacteraceae bacterium]
MTIDQRLEFVTKNIESLHEAVFENSKQIADLRETSERHEREIERFRRAMRAALEAWLGENGSETK